MKLRETTQPIVFKKRPLRALKAELRAAHPTNPQLVADIIAGLKRSSLYAKRPSSSH